LTTAVNRFAGILTLVLALGVGVFHGTAHAQWKYGWSTQFFVPLGDLSEISQIGLSAEVYAGQMIDRRKWAVTLDAGIHWFIPKELTEEEVPDWVADPAPNGNGIVKVSGSFIPLRGSITRLFGRYYVSPRAGVYLPVGDFKKEAGFDPAFGIAPRLGYFFPITRDMQFDLALEYDYVFGDRSLQYFGVSMGILFGGQRLSRR